MKRPYCCWHSAWNRGRTISGNDEVKFSFRSISQSTFPLHKCLHPTPVDCCSPLSSNSRSVHKSNVSNKSSRCSSQRAASEQRPHAAPFKLRHHEVKQDDRRSRKQRPRSNRHCRPLWRWTLEIPWHSAPSPTSSCWVRLMLRLHYFCSCVRAENGAAAWWGGWAGGGSKGHFGSDRKCSLSWHWPDLGSAALF